jgi:hypothetical protein
LKLEKENSFLKNSCEDHKHLLDVLKSSHDELTVTNDYRQTSQAYETITVAFHLGVLQGIVIYIFAKEGKV